MAIRLNFFEKGELSDTLENETKPTVCPAFFHNSG